MCNLLRFAFFPIRSSQFLCTVFKICCQFLSFIQLFIPLTFNIITDVRLQFCSIQSLSCVRLFVTPQTAANQASLSITNSRSLPKLMSIESVMPSNQLILYRPLLLPPSVFPSIRVFSIVSSSHQVAEVLEFQLQHQSFQWIFRTDLLYDGLVGSPCSPRGSQESSPTPQFKSINSLVVKSTILFFIFCPLFSFSCELLEHFLNLILTQLQYFL